MSFLHRHLSTQRGLQQCKHAGSLEDYSLMWRAMQRLNVDCLKSELVLCHKVTLSKSDFQCLCVFFVNIFAYIDK